MSPGPAWTPPCPLRVPVYSPCMDWTRFLTVSGRTLSAAHFSIRTGGMWLYMSRLSTVSGSSCRESMNWLWGTEQAPEWWQSPLRCPPAQTTASSGGNVTPHGLSRATGWIWGPVAGTGMRWGMPQSWYEGDRLGMSVLPLVSGGEIQGGDSGDTPVTGSPEPRVGRKRPGPRSGTAHTYSSTSFLASIFAITSRSSLAFSSLEDKRKIKELMF